MALWFSDMQAAMLALMMPTANAHSHAHQRGGSSSGLPAHCPSALLPVHTLHSAFITLELAVKD